MKRTLFSTIAAGFLISGLVGCGAATTNGGPATSDPNNQPVSSDDPTPTPEPTVNPDEYIFEEARVDSIQILFLESWPLQVTIAVEGTFRNGCIEMHEVTSERDEDTFNVTLTTRHPTGDVACTEALVPFEENVPLDVYGLPAGTYTVNVNGVTDSFTFEQDNALQEPSPPDEPAQGEPSPGEGQEDWTLGIAPVEQVSVQVDGTLSNVPELTIQGYVPDGCTEVFQISHRWQGSTVIVDVTTRRPTDMMCTQAIEPFTVTYSLPDVPGPGTYTVEVNGQASTQFTVQ